MAAFLPDSAASSFQAPDEGMVKAFKLVFGIFLLPFCWVLLETFLVLIHADTLAGNYWRSTEFLAFGIGSALWLLLFFCCRSRVMMWLYVAGHELTHALFVLICRGKVSKVHISSDGGHILTNRNNFLISLSPYFFPFYTVLTILVWIVAGWVVGRSEPVNPVWLYGAIGFTWMFHLSFTVWMSVRDQPDLEQNGRIFSFAIVFFINMLLICCLLILASPTATFSGFAVSFWENASSLLDRFTESAVEVIRALPG
ncbi:MAG: hypothetical protein AAGF67_09290 [Verrucomicrobiota bacterium]